MPLPNGSMFDSLVAAFSKMGAAAKTTTHAFNTLGEAMKTVRLGRVHESDAELIAEMKAESEAMLAEMQADIDDMLYDKTPGVVAIEVSPAVGEVDALTLKKVLDDIHKAEKAFIVTPPGISLKAYPPAQYTPTEIQLLQAKLALPADGIVGPRTSAAKKKVEPPEPVPIDRGARKITLDEE